MPITGNFCFFITSKCYARLAGEDARPFSTGAGSHQASRLVINFSPQAERCSSLSQSAFHDVSLTSCLAIAAGTSAIKICVVNLVRIKNTSFTEFGSRGLKLNLSTLYNVCQTVYDIGKLNNIRRSANNLFLKSL